MMNLQPICTPANLTLLTTNSKNKGSKSFPSRIMHLLIIRHKYFCCLFILPFLICIKTFQLNHIVETFIP